MSDVSPFSLGPGVEGAQVGASSDGPGMPDSGTERAICRLRPVTDEDFEHFDRELFNPESLGPHQWFGYRDPRLARAEFHENGFLTKDGGRLTIEVDGHVAGRVQWRIARWGAPDTPHCWELGFIVFPQWRERGIGLEAGRQLVDYLYNQSPVVRIQAFTDVENRPAQRLLERGGFQKEGVIRAAQWRQGRWHDQVLYSLLRGDWLKSEATDRGATVRKGLGPGGSI